jgi:DUF4097 and DUF4098 domain-containing protein YvlB
MKRFPLVIILSLGVFLLKAQFNASKDPFMTKSLSGQTIKNVEVETSGGNIEVTGGAAGNYRLEVYVRPNNYRNSDNFSKEDLQKLLDEYYDLNISVENSKLTAIAKPRKNNMDWKKGVNVSFKVFIQQSVSTDLSTSGGNIVLSNLSGSQDFSTSGGNLEIESLSGKIKGRTSGGNINLTNSKDDIDVSTSGGNIKADKCNGKIKLSTSGGSLKLSALNGNINASTSGGNVDGTNIDGDLAAHTSGGNIDLDKLNCSLETSTSGGNIDVEITTLKQFVKINNSGGNINLRVPNKAMDLRLTGGRVKTDKLNNFSGSIDDESIKGKLNGGGVPVTVDAGGGRITLSMNQ